jgi:hypothetical protein
MTVEDRLRAYVEELFISSPPTKKAVELREEMLQNLADKYGDLIAEGKSPEAAYNIAVAGIGDIDELLKELERDMDKDINLNEVKKRSALYVAVSIMMYILSPLPLSVASILAPGRFSAVFGLVALFALIAGATGLLIYNSMTKPRFLKKDDSMVEEFKEWQRDTHEKRSLRKAISSAMWCIIVVIYFVVSFATGAWYITWIAFIIGAALESLISILFVCKS